MLQAVKSANGTRTDAFKIGQLAAQAAVSVDAVRFYERRGILPPPERRPSGYRIYRRADVDRILMTKALQRLGFTLDEVIGALEAFDAGSATCGSERWRLEAVLGRVDAKIEELQRLRREIARALESCGGGHCAVLPNVTAGAGTKVAPRRGRAARAGVPARKQPRRR